MLIKLQLLVLIFFVGQATASSAAGLLCGAGAASEPAIRAIRGRRGGLTVDTAAPIFEQEDYDRRLKDKYVCHKFRKNFKILIADQQSQLIAKGFDSSIALKKAEKIIFARVFTAMNEKGIDRLTSGSADEWSNYLKDHNYSIRYTQVPGTFNLLRHDPFLVVRK